MHKREVNRNIIKMFENMQKALIPHKSRHHSTVFDNCLFMDDFMYNIKEFKKY